MIGTAKHTKKNVSFWKRINILYGKVKHRKIKHLLSKIYSGVSAFMLSKSFFILLFLVYLCTLFFYKEVINIGYGCYFASSPMDLKAMIQKSYSKTNWKLLSLIPFKNSFLFSVYVQDVDDDYNYIERCANGDERQMAVVNTYGFLNLSDSTRSKLEVIGRKKEDKNYYTTRFVWNKHIADLPSSQCQSIEQILKFAPNTPIVLNCNLESSSTYNVPKIYLLEKQLDTIPFLVTFDNKKNVLDEVVKKNQLIGVVSNSEFSKQLGTLKDSLFIQDIMINIPHDYVVANKAWWGRKDEHERKRILKALGDANLIERYSSRKDTINMIKGVVLNELFKYYVSMAISTKDSLYVLPSNPLKFEYNLKDTFCVYKTVYGNIRDPYYSFRKEMCNIKLDTLSKASVRGCRIVPLKYALRLDSLMNLNRILRQVGSVSPDNSYKNYLNILDNLTLSDMNIEILKYQTLNNKTNKNDSIN